MSLSPAQFDWFRILLRTRSGIEIDEARQYLVDARLLPLARQAGYECVADYISRLQTSPVGPDHERAVQALGTRETSFFRDGAPFVVLQRHILPELIRKRAATKSINIWSAACSTGQEPYSIAILIHEQFPMLRTWNVRILASDFSLEAVERAREGRYFGLEVARGMPAELLDRNFHFADGAYHVCDALKKLVDVRLINLMEPLAMLTPMDVIFLRNVLIYFHVDGKRAVLERIRRVLRPDGCLFLGGAETTVGLDESFEPAPFDRGCCYRLKKHAMLAGARAE